MAEILDQATYAEVMPEVRDVKVDRLGNVWLARYTFVGTAPTQWEVFDPDGVWLGTVTTPTGLEIHAISADEIMGLFQDEDGVSMVRVHRIRKDR